jgi:YfiH family protein
MNHLKLRNPNAESMTEHFKDGVLYLTFPSLDKEKWLVNAFSTRLGGVSKEHLSAMNFGLSKGDDPENLRENFRRFQAAVGFEAERLVMSHQKHTTNVLRVGKNDCGTGYDERGIWTDIDGFITNEPGICLVTFYADCVPLFVADPVHHAIGLSHSGWRGTAAKMGKVTVERMQEEFGSNPSDLIAAIGPSICQSCYEVSSDVAELFPEEVTQPHGEGHALLDLTEANRLIFMEAGIPASQISFSNLCTACNREILFSHRGSGGKCGLLAGFMEILP